MNNESQEFYTSKLSDPFINDQISQEELNEEGLELYQYNSVIDSIGTSDSLINIKLFLDDVLSRLDNEKSFIFFEQCFDKINEVYGFTYLDSTKYLFKSDSKFNKHILDLLLFIEGSSLIDMLSECIPYISYDILKSKENLKKYLNINYNVFLKSLFSYKGSLPRLIKSQFKYSAKDDSINSMILLIQKDVLSLHVKQLIKGK